MKKLFCVVITDVSGQYFESPAVYHINCIDRAKAEEVARESLIEDGGFDDSDIDIDDCFDFDIFEVYIIEE